MSLRFFKIKEDSFFKEVIWALLILLLSFLPYLHLLWDDTLSNFELFGVIYTHRFLSNQAFLYFLLIYFQLLAFLMLLVYLMKNYFRIALFAPIYWSVLGLFWTVIPIYLYNNNRYIFKLSSAIIALVFIYKLGFEKRQRRLLRYKLRIHHFFMIILFLTITIALITFENMSSTILTLNVLGYDITPHGFESVPNFLWVLSQKFLLLITLAYLFLRIKEWWKYVFILPILITTHQFHTVIFLDSEVMDEYEITQALPLLLLVLILLLFLSRSAYYNAKLKNLYKITFSQIEKKRVMAIQDQLGAIKKRWKETLTFTSKTENIEELRTFKKELERQLREL